MLSFSQTREDPRLDARALAIEPGACVVSVDEDLSAELVAADRSFIYHRCCAARVRP